MKFQLPDKAVMDPLVLYRLLSHDTFFFFFKPVLSERKTCLRLKARIHIYTQTQ